MTDRRSVTLATLIDYLRYLRECGAVSLELEPETLRTLAHLKESPPTRAPAGGGTGGGAGRAAGSPRGAARPILPSRATTVSAGGGQAAINAALAEIKERIVACRKCELCHERSNVVPGQGNPVQPEVLFIGEAPGADEDRQGLAFVGRAGQLLTKMIAGMGFMREEVFIANICKCRPPGNRPPTPAEMEACLPFLKEQIGIIRPRTIVAMGNTAILGLLGSAGITRLRGIWASFEGIPLMPTFHPAYLLRFPTVKRDAWADLKKVLRRLDRPIPPPAPKEGAKEGAEDGTA